jgi:competence protein ComEC
VVLVPSGWAGVAVVAAGGVTLAVAWRWRWGRLLAAAGALVLLAWSVSGHAVAGGVSAA